MADDDNVTPLREGEPDPVGFMSGPRGQYILAKALHYAIQHIGSQPEHMREHNDRDDMVFILNGVFPGYSKTLRDADIQRGV